MVLVIFPPQGRLPEIAVTVEDVTIVDGRHLVAIDLDHSLLHDRAAQVLNHGPVCIFTIQRDSEDQAVSPWNDHVVRAEVRESNQQLLILINRARVIGYHDELPHSLDPKGLTEAPVRIKLAPEFTARSHGAFEPTIFKLASTVNAAIDDVTLENPTFDPDWPGEDDDFDLPNPLWSHRLTSSSCWWHLH